MSLAANIAAAPRLDWQPVLVAGWPPVALLLAVELLAHRSPRRTKPNRPWLDTAAAAPVAQRGNETRTETGKVFTLAEVSRTTEQASEPTAQEIMWAYGHPRAGLAAGRQPARN
ncbi:MAG: hypothetical protein ACJ72N_00670 [Labedaea sp.]